MEKAQKLFIDLLADDKAETIFNENFREIRLTVVDYQYLRYIYNKPEHSLSIDKEFQKLFKTFYIMHRYTSDKFSDSFFKVMDEIKSKKRLDLDAVQITKELADIDHKWYFSFVTKMLNLEDDERFPIYDQMVGKVCGLKESSKYENKEAKFSDWYNKINAIYSDLLDGEYKEHTRKIISLFRKIFKCQDENELSDMRIMDILFWQLGKTINTSETKKQTLNKETRVAKVLSNNEHDIETKIALLSKIGLKRMDIIDKGFDKKTVFEWFYKNK